MRKPDGTCGIRYVESTGWWKVRLGGVGGEVIRICPEDMKTLVEYIEAYGYKNFKKPEEMDALYYLMEELPRDWFDTLVEVDGRAFGSHRICNSDLKLARHRKVSSGYLLLRDRVKRVWEDKVMSEEEMADFLARIDWNIHVALLRGRFDWYEDAIQEKRLALKEAKLSRNELLEMWAKAKQDEFGV